MSRSSSIAAHLRQRRIERRKPRRTEPLKRMSLDANQRNAVSQAQAHPTNAPIALRKPTARNSSALTVSLVLHAIAAFIISVYYIADRLVPETETIAGVLVVKEDSPRVRPPLVKPRPRFEAQPEETPEVVPQDTVKTNPAVPRFNEGKVIPQAPDTLDVPGPPTTDGPRQIEPKRELQQPTRAPEFKTNPPDLGPKRLEGSPFEKIEPTEPNESPDAPGGVIPWFFPSKKPVPKFKVAMKPDYPVAAKRAGKEGTVLLQVTIDENGVPQDIVVVTGPGFGFEDAAIAALRKSTFIPAMLEGKPVSATVRIPFEFTLED